MFLPVTKRCSEPPGVRQKAAIEMMRTMLRSKTQERSGPETLHNILTRLDVSSSGYFEDEFKVVLSFVKSRHSPRGGRWSLVREPPGVLCKRRGVLYFAGERSWIMGQPG